MIDSTTVELHQDGAGAKKSSGPQDIGKSVIGNSTKIHAAVDSFGRPITLFISPGNQHDSRVAIELAEAAEEFLLADRGYDDNKLRQHLIEKGVTPVIPGRKSRLIEIEYDKEIYTHLIHDCLA